MSLAGACQLSQQHEENKGDMNSCRNSFTDYSHDDDDGDDEGRTELKGDLGLIIWASLADPPSSSPLPWYVATREQNVPAPEWEEPISGRVIYTARRGGSCLPSNTWKLERRGVCRCIWGGGGGGGVWILSPTQTELPESSRVIGTNRDRAESFPANPQVP